MNILNKHTPIIGDDVGKSHVFQVDNIENASPRNSTAEKRRVSSVSVSECRVDLDLKSDDVKTHLANVKMDCRICHLSMDMNNQDEHEFETPIELGCSCKDDLAAAHKQCAETWFKIKGNKTCEICGSIASNVTGHVVEVEMTEQWNEVNEASMLPPTEPSPTTAETQSFLRGQWFLNFILVCMVFAFILRWLFHFNMPS